MNQLLSSAVPADLTRRRLSRGFFLQSIALLLVTVGACFGTQGGAPTVMRIFPTSGSASAPLTLEIEVVCSSVTTATPIAYFGLQSLGTPFQTASTSNSCTYSYTLSTGALSAALNGSYIQSVPVTIQNSIAVGDVSAPALFTVLSGLIDPASVSSGFGFPGDSIFVGNESSLTGLGVSATLAVDPGAPPNTSVAVTVSTYLSQPTAPGLIFEVGGGIYYDLFAPTAGANDTIVARFYYPASIADSAALLNYFNGASYVPVSPILFHSTTDSAGFGGYFDVEFDGHGTSVPQIQQLNGTVFTIAPTPLDVVPSVLWPPNHKMVIANVLAPAGSSIVSVTSSEPDRGLGHGDVGPDFQIVGPLRVKLRAERGGRDGRIYSILVQLADGSQNVAVVRVPADSRCDGSERQGESGDGEGRENENHGKSHGR